MSSSATVTVEVTDTNDNQPVFENPTYMAAVNESAFPGTVITTITATDRDTGVHGQEGIVYELVGEDVEKYVVCTRLQVSLLVFRSVALGNQNSGLVMRVTARTW